MSMLLSPPLEAPPPPPSVDAPEATTTTIVAPTVYGVPAYRVSISWHLGAPEDISYTVWGPDATGLLAGQPPPANGLYPISLDGTEVDARMLSTGTELTYDQPGYVTETGKSIAYALQTSAFIHRLTAQQVSVADVFTATAGSILTQDGHTIVGAGGYLPDQAGIGTFGAGPYTFTYTVDPTVGPTILDVDINEDNALHACQVICDRMGSYVDPQQTQFWLDSGDKGPSGMPSVRIGSKGGADHLTFDLDGAAGNAPVLRGSSAQAQTTDQCHSCSFKGGDAHHGLPSSGRMTDLQVIHQTGMAIVGVYASIGVGGVFFWPGDGALYPMSQAMGVNGIWYDHQGSVTGGTTSWQIYAATDAGIYWGSEDTLSGARFTRVGKMSLKCYKVQAEQLRLYCLAETAGTTQRHVLQFTPGSAAGVAYEDWTQVHACPDLADFAVLVSTVYGTLRNSPGTIWVLDITTGHTQIVTLPTGADAAIIGLDPIGNGTYADHVYVRTSLGSDHLYYFTSLAPTTLVQANTDGSLLDDYNNPVLVNRIRANPAGHLACTGTNVIATLLAATSLGIFYTSTEGQTLWKRTDGQSNIGDFSATDVGAQDDTAGSFGSHTWQACYAIADTALYYSYNGTVNWNDAMSAPLDAGPFFYNYFRKGFAGGGNHWPTQSDTSISITNSQPDNPTHPAYPNGPYTLTRILTGIGTFAYVLSNPSGSSPADQHRTAELSEIAAPANYSEITASRILVDAMARFLAYTAAPQTILTIQSFYDVLDTTNALRTLRPCMRVSVIGNPMEYLIAPGLSPFSLGTFAGTYYVLDHTISYDRDQDPSSFTTTTRLGSLLLSDRQDPLHVTADLYYQMSRIQTYKSRARR
jgi:hypothetical protein